MASYSKLDNPSNTATLSFQSSCNLFTAPTVLDAMMHLITAGLQCM